MGKNLRPFFVVGLPRSGTTWWANFLTYGDSFCLHDGLSGLRSPEELAERFRQTGARFYGDADSGVPLFFERIIELFPEARFVLVHRPSVEVVESYLQFAKGTPREGLMSAEEVAKTVGWLGERLKGMEKALKGRRVLRVEFKDIGNVEVAREVWRFCVPGTAFHRPRWELLSRMRVNPFLEDAVVHPEMLKCSVFSGQCSEKVLRKD